MLVYITITNTSVWHTVVKLSVKILWQEFLCKFPLQSACDDHLSSCTTSFRQQPCTVVCPHLAACDKCDVFHACLSHRSWCCCSICGCRWSCQHVHSWPLCNQHVITIKVFPELTSGEGMTLLRFKNSNYFIVSFKHYIKNRNSSSVTHLNATNKIGNPDTFDMTY